MIMGDSSWYWSVLIWGVGSLCVIWYHHHKWEKRFDDEC